MTKKERVLSAMRGEKTDKIPVSFWRHFAGAGTTLSNREVAQKHLDFYQATDLDFIKIMYDGCTAPFSLDIKTAAELRKIRPVKEDHPYVRDILERAKWVNELLSDQVDTWMNLFSPFMLIKKLGEKQLAALIDQDRYAVIDALTAVGETLSYTAEKLLTECGCKGIFVCFQGAESNGSMKRGKTTALSRSKRSLSAFRTSSASSFSSKSRTTFSNIPFWSC